MLEKRFEFEKRESELYKLWEESGCFKPEAASDQKAPVFNISMPPPNANGELHIGHVFGYTLMDILGRFHRLKGERTLLLPGKDHAGIQTQVVFEKKLKAEGVDVRQESSASLYERCYAFCIDRAQYMRNQEKTIGLSADWSRELFTLDARVSDIVFETFERMWADGLVYRGNRIVNWSVFSQTSISDVEVEYKEQDGNLWFIRYPLAPGQGDITDQTIKLPSGTEVQIGRQGMVTATTRPETMLGDTALAVNPEDPRYKGLIGKRVVVPLVNREIPIIADKRVDSTYGTGVVKVTPAHDFADYDMGVDHKLPMISVIGKDGLMTEAAGAEFKGLKIAQCREAVVAKLTLDGLLLDTSTMKHKVPIGERGKDIIEPLISEQWWVNVDKPGNSLKARALEMLRSGKIKIYPERFTVLFEQWLENLHDWNISRQLWWGHRLPVWYRTQDGKTETYVGRKAPEGPGWEQEKDVFDTWFSSGQWAYSTVAAQGLYSLESKASSAFFPTNTMVMGRDILLFWACRMLLLSAYRVGDVPWKNIFFTGLIRDEHGQKMSKSKGNGVEPKEVIGKYGADSLRLAMIMGSTPGNDINFSIRKVEGYSKFINKIWNAAKLLELKVAPLTLPTPESNPPLQLDSSAWILAEIARLEQLVTEKMNQFEISIAADEIYRVTWTVFCDWYLEMMKVLIDSGNTAWATEAGFVARHCFQRLLTLLHPFIPFVTEEIYQQLPLVQHGKMLATSSWEGAKVNTAGAADSMQVLMEVVSAVRSVKATLQIPHKRIRIAVSQELSPEHALLLQELARAENINAQEIPENLALRKPFSAGTLVYEVEGKERYRERLEADLAQHRQIIVMLEGKLSGAFATQAKPDVVEKERERLEQSRTASQAIEKELAIL